MEWKLSRAALKKLNPCESSFERVSALLPKRGGVDAREARCLGCTYDDIIWAASAIAMNDDVLKRRMISYVNDNAKAVLHIFERANPGDMRVRECIAATDGFLDGSVTDDEWGGKARAAWDAWGARDARAAWAAWGAWDAWGARDARAAWAAWGARDAWVAWDARAAWGALDARAAQDARAAWDAWGARDAWAAQDARAAWGALDARAAWAAQDARGARDAFHDWQFDRLIYWLTEVDPVALPTPEIGVPALPEIDALNNA